MFEDLLVNLILLLLAFWIGYRLGKTSVAVNMARLFITDPNKMRQMMADIERVARDAQLEDTAQDQMTVVKDQEQFYLYRKSNNEFLAQGSTLKEALDLVAKRFPQENFTGAISKELAEQWGLSNKN
jgi:hypothetical protein